jgi:hypothetical protein
VDVEAEGEDDDMMGWSGKVEELLRRLAGRSVRRRGACAVALCRDIQADL